MMVLFGLGYRITDRKDVIDADVARWKEVRGTDAGLWRLPEFRSLFYHRLWSGNRAGRLCGAVLRRLRPGERTLYLQTAEIGPGLFIQHGFATILAAERVGANCWLNQQVTVGYTHHGGCPTIEDDVNIGAGAKVLGEIVVGRGSWIGANAVVVRDVPPGSTAVGVPARYRPRTSSDPA
jgi:serine O-acetyltransferase